MASTALGLYDTLLMFSQEVTTIWRRKFNVVSVLFICARFVLVSPLPLSIADIWKRKYTDGPSMADPLYAIGQVLTLTGFLLPAVFSAMRAAALSNKRWLVFAVVFLLGAVPVGTDAFGTYRSRTIVYNPPGGGQETVSEIDVSPNLNKIMLLLTRIPPMLADSIVIAITVARTFKLRREASHMHMRSPLMDCLLRDGALYFIALFTLNLCRILTDSSPVQGTTAINSFVQILPMILMCRFMIALRQTSEDVSTGNEVTPSMWSAVRFRIPNSMLASMSGPLESLHHGDIVDEDVQVDQATIDSNDIADREA